VVSSTPWSHFTPGKDTVPILQQAGWAPGPVWTGGKSRPRRDSIPDRPVRSQSLYRLRYPAHSDLIYWSSFSTATCFCCVRQPSSGSQRFIKGIKRGRLLLTNNGCKIVMKYLKNFEKRNNNIKDSIRKFLGIIQNIGLNIKL